MTPMHPRLAIEFGPLSLPSCSTPHCAIPASIQHGDYPWCPSCYRRQPGNILESDALTSVERSDSIEASPSHLTLLRFEESTMPENGTIAYINEPRGCDFPHPEVRFDEPEPKAEYDFRTSDGRWANGCSEHYLSRRMHNTLGIGKGQRLVVRPDIVGPVIPAGGDSVTIFEGTPIEETLKMTVAPNEHDSSDLL